MKKIFTTIVSILGFIGAFAQQGNKTLSADSMLNLMSNTETQHEKILPAFNATRLIFSPTTETVKKNNLNFLIIHRFGDMGTAFGGFRTFFGLDAVSDVYLGFEYGFTDDFQVSVGRNSIGQMGESQFKWAFLHQSTDGYVPFNLTLLAGDGIRPYGNFTSFGDRLSYIAEIIVSRKFSRTFSFEVSPVYVRDNQPLPFVAGNPPGFFALSTAFRWKLTRRMSLLADYEHPFSSYRNNSGNFEDPLGFGAEFETGGHVFTLNITNARAISQINLLSNSPSSYGRGQFRLGFTISRMFDFNKKKNSNNY